MNVPSGSVDDHRAVRAGQRIEPGSTLFRKPRLGADRGGRQRPGRRRARRLLRAPFRARRHVLLDFLDQRTARDADNSLGINNSNVFAKWFDSELDAFGSKSRMNVAANTWILGLAIEF